MPQTFDSRAEDGAAAATPGDSRPYEDLSAMINQGRSFSGHERNCFFLNLGDGTFADASAGSGLDFDDDARAVAAVDWDHDGDLDLWISNRNAPRLRLLRNDSPQAGRHHVSIRLQGDGTTINRDAIGARIILEAGSRKEVGESARQVRGLRAGEGFLTQTSKWLHFGLGETEDISKVSVRWPGGEIESFEGVRAGGRFLLVQGAGVAKPATPRPMPASALQPVEPVTSRPPNAARVPAVTLVPAPKLKIQNPGGGVLATGEGTPVLVNLWATWCAPCLAELAAFSREKEKFARAGVAVVALCVDDADQSGASESAGAGASGSPEKVLAKMNFPFASANATPALLDSLQEFHDGLVGLQRPLPLPSSFLIDAEGRLAVIYKGPVTVAQVVADLQHSKQSRRDRWMAAAALPGSSLLHPRVIETADIAEASIHFRQGIAEEARGQTDAALYHYKAAAALAPEFPAVLGRMANLYYQQQDMARAAQARFQLAALMASSGDHAAAVSHYRSGLGVAPATNLPALNNLAWLLATSRDETVRDGQEALRIATELAAYQDGSNPNLLDTLAAAQAECGKFDEAIATAERAVGLARKTGETKLADTVRKRLLGYRRGKPVRE